jgi:hypothetical protein
LWDKNRRVKFKAGSVGKYDTKKLSSVLPKNSHRYWKMNLTNGFEKNASPPNIIFLSPLEQK